MGGNEMTVWYVPIQPLEERYTEQWSRWIPESFMKRGLHFDTIWGSQLTEKIEKGSFLDVNGANYYTFDQLKQISKLFHEKKIKNGDQFFFGDIEFPGHAEAVKHMATLQGINVELYGFLHACTVTNEDLVQPLEPWQKFMELGWISACDGVFVGTEYFRNKIIEKRIKTTAPKSDWNRLSNKIHVTGNPWNSKEAKNLVGISPTKVKRIIFPNRFDYEKRPNIFLDLCLILHDIDPDIQFMITSSSDEMKSRHPWLLKLYKAIYKVMPANISSFYKLSKKMYYSILAQSKVMFSSSIEETFGYCALEAMTFGTIPICPNNYSYPEVTFHYPQYLYNNMDEAIEKCLKALNNKTIANFGDQVSYYDKSMDRIIDVMCGVKPYYSQVLY